MKPLYLSHLIKESSPVYGGATGTITQERIRSISRGDTSNNLLLKFPNHIGTHIDFPYHFSDSGKNLADYQADFWIFNKIGFVNCDFLSLSEQLDQLPFDMDFLIVKTGFGDYREQETYWKNQPVIPARTAGILKKKFPELKLVGFDMISLTSQLDKAEGKSAHLAFLIEHDVLVLEDMKLDELFETPETVFVCPLLIDHADGSPCTVIAV